MFYLENGIKLMRAGLALDFRRRQPRAFVSHAHFDHMARHELALCTPVTACMYQHRMGKRPVQEIRLRETIHFGGLRLTTFPAGHCFGSAMLLAEDGERRLLYTGDFKLRPSATAEPAELPKADIMIMESTFGRPQYRFPPREQAIAALVELVRDVLDRGDVPVLHLYPLGKSQEVTKILSEHGIGVLQHPEIYAISRVYEACGMPLGIFQPYRDQPRRGWAVITLPKTCPRFRLPGLKNVVSIAVTGWAAANAGRAHAGIDHAVPLSDHADYDELLEAVRRVNPAKIYCTHGPPEFADELRRAGWNAQRLDWSTCRAIA